MVAAATPAPAPPRYRRVNGRLWIGPYLVPDHPFVVGEPCPICGGAALHDEGEIRCLMCARELVVESLGPGGRVTGLALRHPGQAELVRVNRGQSRRTARALSKAEGLTGLQARILRQLPAGDTEHAVVETIATAVSMPRTVVRGALEAMAVTGLVERFEFAGGYRVGWRRAPRP